MVPGPMRGLRLARSGAARRYGLWPSAIGDLSRKMVTSLSLNQKDEQKTVLPVHEQAQGYQEVGGFLYSPCGQASTRFRECFAPSPSLNQKDEQETVLPARERRQGYQEVGYFPYSPCGRAWAKKACTGSEPTRSGAIKTTSPD